MIIKYKIISDAGRIIKEGSFHPQNCIVNVLETSRLVLAIECIRQECGFDISGLKFFISIADDFGDKWIYHYTDLNRVQKNTQTK